MCTYLYTYTLKPERAFSPVALREDDCCFGHKTVSTVIRRESFLHSTSFIETYRDLLTRKYYNIDRRTRYR